MTQAIQIDRIGGPEVLAWRQVASPDPGPDEVVVRQKAIGVNYIDVYHRTGLYPLPLPFVPGIEGAGIVESVGRDVEDVAPGDRVAYGGVVGGYSELRAVPAGRLLKLPPSISFETAAAMMLQGLTAQALLKQVRRVHAGETILVHAAAGGTGLLLCQWAASLGATVIGTVSNHEKAELARRNGCHHPLVHSEVDFVRKVAEITDGKKVPVVYDSIGADTFLRSLDCLAPRGLMVSFGQASGPVPAFELALLARKGSLYLTRPSVFTYIDRRADLVAMFDDLVNVVASGDVKIQVNHRYALKDAAQAHAALESRSTTGSLVLIP